jgi:ribonuclease BN (tRNA processing enzyme)
VKRRDFLAGLAASPSIARATGDGAQPTDAAARPPAPLTVTFLGTGTPAPSLERQSSGYLIAVGRDLIVWDHGPGAHQRLIESGHRSIDVTHACFTHLHYDHCMDYGRLVLQRWDQGAGRIGELQVYGPPPIARMTEQLFGVDGIYGPDIRARVEHRSSLDVYEARGGSLCYTGDSGPSDAIVELARGCDLLIHMNHYFSGTEPSPAYRAACGTVVAPIESRQG